MGLSLYIQERAKTHPDELKENITLDGIYAGLKALGPAYDVHLKLKKITFSL